MKCSARQPVAAFTCAQPADCRRCGRAVSCISRSQWRSSFSVTGRALTGPGLSISVDPLPQHVAPPAPGSGGVFPWGGGRRGKLACREGALRVPLATVEHRAAPATPAHELALPAFGADHAGLLLGLLDVLAVGVAGAADEGPKPAAAPGERLAALGTDLALEDLELRLLLTLERLGAVAGAFPKRFALLALLEPGARVETPVPAQPDHHPTSALRTH